MKTVVTSGHLRATRLVARTCRGWQPDRRSAPLVTSSRVVSSSWPGTRAVVVKPVLTPGLLSSIATGWRTWSLGLQAGYGKLSSRRSYSSLLQVDARTMIHIRDLKKSYQDLRRGEFVALAGISLTANSGEIYGLLGPNGAGKTTALRILSTVLKPTSGTVTVNGHDVVTKPALVRHSTATRPPQSPPPAAPPRSPQRSRQSTSTPVMRRCTQRAHVPPPHG